MSAEHISLMNAGESPGLYIHVPFCRRKCPYCGFYSIASRSPVERWLNALEKEILFYKDIFRQFDSIYFGGGTPSVLKSKELERIIDCVFSNFNILPDSEISFEANPCDLSGIKIKTLRNLGFNRVSLGVQAFDDEVLSFLGRMHTVNDARQALGLLRSHGFENIGIDLIYGIEGHVLEKWMGNLMEAMEFHPEHISCYQLTIEKHTVFEQLRKKGLMNPLGEDETSLFFLETVRILKDKGYVHYEVSNFAKHEIYMSRHNQKYWRHVPYLGLGPASHSFYNSARWWNFPSVRKYCEALEQDQLPVCGREQLAAEQLRLESISLGLRTREGFDIGQMSGDDRTFTNLSQLRSSGHVIVHNGRVVPTTKGLLVADHLALCLSG